MKQKITCANCGAIAWKEAGAITRAARKSAPMFCSRVCMGLARRWAEQKTPEQRKEEKRIYDVEYRANNSVWIKLQKVEWFAATYDPVKAAEQRKKRMPAHIEYCRRPEYVAYKREYDRHRRAEEFGPFAESHMLLIDLENAILKRATRYEIDSSKNTINKKLNRRREYDKALSGKP